MTTHLYPSKVWLTAQPSPGNRLSVCLQTTLTREHRLPVSLWPGARLTDPLLSPLQHLLLPADNLNVRPPSYTPSCVWRNLSPHNSQPAAHQPSLADQVGCLPFGPAFSASECAVALSWHHPCPARDLGRPPVDWGPCSWASHPLWLHSVVGFLPMEPAYDLDNPVRLRVQVAILPRTGCPTWATELSGRAPRSMLIPGQADPRLRFCLSPTVSSLLTIHLFLGKNHSISCLVSLPSVLLTQPLD